MEPWDKAFLQIVSFAVLSAISVKLHITQDAGAPFLALCGAGAVAFVAASTAHLWP